MMDVDEGNFNTSAFLQENAEKTFRARQQKARLSGKPYISQNKLKNFPAKQPPTLQVSSFIFFTFNISV